jgi:hypothetical protein
MIRLVCAEFEALLQPVSDGGTLSVVLSEFLCRVACQFGLILSDQLPNNVRVGFPLLLHPQLHSINLDMQDLDFLLSAPKLIVLIAQDSDVLLGPIFGSHIVAEMDQQMKVLEKTVLQNLPNLDGRLGQGTRELVQFIDRCLYGLAPRLHMFGDVHSDLVIYFRY